MAFSDAAGDAVASGKKRHVVCHLEEIPPSTVRGYRTGNRRIALARLDDDLITIPKYPGKTNEQFTKLLLNVTVLSSASAALSRA